MCPAPSGEYGVHEYCPSSDDITGCRMSVPCLFTLACWTVWKSSIRPSFDQTTTVRGGLDSTGQSIRPTRPRGRYRRSGMLNTRGRSAAQTTQRLHLIMHPTIVLTDAILTRKLCYRKDDRAMRPIYRLFYHNFAHAYVYYFVRI